MLSKSSDAWKALWLRAATNHTFPRGRATGMMFAVRSILLTMQPLVLSLLLAASERVAIIVVGIICVMGATVFYATTRDGDLVPDDWEPPAYPSLFEE